MTSNLEQQERWTDDGREPWEIRLNALVDSSGIPYNRALELLGISLSEMQNAATPPQKKPEPTSRSGSSGEQKKGGRSRRYSRRGGRSYNEGSDSEHDPNWNISNWLLLGEQQKALNQRGRTAVLAASGGAPPAEIAAIIDGTNQPTLPF